MPQPPYSNFGALNSLPFEEQYLQEEEEADDIRWEYKALNYISNDQYKNTVQSIQYLRDFALLDIPDMGHGTFVTELPHELTAGEVVDITQRFKNLRYDPTLFPDYNHPDIDVRRLNKISIADKDSFIGLYKCGEGEADRY